MLALLPLPQLMGYASSAVPAAFHHVWCAGLIEEGRALVCVPAAASRSGLCYVLRLSPKVCYSTNTVWASWNKIICFSHLHHICKCFSGDSVPCEAFIFQRKKSRTQKGRLNIFRNKQPYKTTWALLEINPKTKANPWNGVAAKGSSAWELLAFGSNMGSILLAGYLWD